MMIQRDILEEVGGFKTHLAEDFELILRLYMAGYEVLYREGISVPAECASDPWEWFFRSVSSAFAVLEFCRPFEKGMKLVLNVEPVSLRVSDCPRLLDHS